MTWQRIAMVAVLVPSIVQAQTAEQLLTSARAAFENLDFETAIRDYQRVLDIGTAVTRMQRDTAQMYLAVSYEFAGQTDNTLRTFRTLIRENPCTRTPEEFGGSVSAAFVEARGGIFALGVCDLAIQRLATGDSGRFTIAATRPAVVQVHVRDSTGVIVLDLGEQPVEGLADVAWVARAELGVLPSVPTPYELVIAGEERDGTSSDSRIVPLLVHVPVPDTLPHPEELPDSLFLPEQRSGASALGDLAKGLGIGIGATAATAGLIYASLDADLRQAAVVGGAISVVGMAAFFKGNADRAIPENQDYNERIRRQWLDQRGNVIAENARRRAAPLMLIIEPAGEQR